jgi:hypothetical protein
MNVVLTCTIIELHIKWPKINVGIGLCVCTIPIYMNVQSSYKVRLIYLMLMNSKFFYISMIESVFDTFIYNSK